MRSRAPNSSKPTRGGFTLVEVLAALLLMAIIIPVALQGMSTVTRAAELGQAKVTAMRVAERILDEQMVQISQGQPAQSSASGIETDGGTAYPWTLETKPWPADSMTQMTVRVRFTVRGTSYDMHASTLYDPGAATPGVTPPVSNTQ